MTNPHGMTDLETLGLDCAGAPIMQMAVTVFHPRVPGILNSWSCRVTLESNELAGRRAEPDTLDWWQKPERASLWQKLIDNPKAVPLVDALASMAEFVIKNDVKEIWANGPSFDISMLECAYRHFLMRPPWSHRDVRDTRTIWALAAEKHPPFALESDLVRQKLGWERFEGDDVPHDALSDCFQQTLKVQMAYTILDMDSAHLKALA